MDVSHTPALLSRDAFRESVFARDRHRCVLCQAPGQDAHHVLERRLFPDGGYYLDNGATVCGPCHLACERTEVSVEDVRHAAGIVRIVVPPHLYADQPYDKWGNPVLPNGQRMRGELFFDNSVQKVLREAGVLGAFTHWVKYPRTYHLPWSPGLTADDRMVEDMSPWEGRRVVVTEKMDGENTTLYCDYLHARSVDGRSHPSQAWVKQLHGNVGYQIPEGWRLCGENLYAEHSIGYDALPSYFMGFSLWNDRNECLSWADTREWLELLDLTCVPVLYEGPYRRDVFASIERNLDFSRSEGYVLRCADAFGYADFRHRVAKYVRRDHVTQSAHWRHGKPVKPNGLAP